MMVKKMINECGIAGKIPSKPMIPLFKVFMSKKVMKPLRQVLFSGYIGQGVKVDEFESKLQEFFENPYVFTVNSGTSALHLALRLAGVKHGDEVISTPMTCTASNWPILQHGAKIVWSDIDPADGNIDPESIKKLVNKRTKAILCVDWGGYPCDIKRIRQVAPGIPIIQDCAHGVGAIYNGKKVGNWADFTCYSFQAIKHLTTVDGGAVATLNKKDFDRGILLRWYGINRKEKSKDERIEQDVHEWGYKFHMNDVNATIGLENLKYTNRILKKHRSNAAFYKRNLKNIDGLTFLREKEGDVSSYWLFTIKVKNRSDFIDYMKNNGVHVSQVHRRNDTHPTVSEFLRPLPGVDAYTAEMVCIPVGWWVSGKDRQKIVCLIKDFFASQG